MPVTLERSDARDRFQLKHSGEDVGDNLSLAAMLARTLQVGHLPPSCTRQEHSRAVRPSRGPVASLAIR